MYIAAQRQILGEIRSDRAQGLRVKVLWGVIGSGKTSLVHYLHQNAKPGGAVRILCGSYDAGHHGEVGEDASLGAIRSNFEKFASILKRIMEKTAGEDVCSRVQQLVVQTRQSEIYEARIPAFEENLKNVNVPVQPRQLEAAWGRAADHLADGFLQLWRDLQCDQQRLLLFDDFDVLEDQLVGLWLADLLSKLDSALVVVTRSTQGSLSQWASGAIRVLELERFDRIAVATWLKEKVGDVSTDLVEQICDVTEGHPATLTLVYEMLWGSGQPPASGGGHLLDDLPSNLHDRLAVLTERFILSLEDSLLSRILEAASIPRHFDRDLVFTLIGDESLTKRQLHDAFKKLAQYSFVEDVSEEEDGSRLQLHPAIRQSLASQLKTADEAHFAALNEVAANYYAAKLTDDDRPTPYGHVSLYEEPLWQMQKREWLYHLSLASTTRQKATALLELTYVCLDAFWWWGNYIHFDFCDQLVADIGALAAVRKEWRELATLQQLLATFLTHYPVRSAKPTDSKWEEVRDCLNGMQRICRLERKAFETEVTSLEAEERKVVALLNVFWAHAWWYSREDVAQAQLCYERARSQFEDDWSKAWVEFEHADLLAQLGDMPSASRRWASGVKHMDPDDEELASNLHRLMGDMFWEQGDREAAAQAYGKAVLHAYLFNIVNGPSDEYTMQFYVDVRGNALRRLYEVWDAGDTGTTLRLAKLMASELGPALDLPDDADLQGLFRARLFVQLALALFPRGPEVEELEEADTEFERELMRVQNRLDRLAVSRDLNTYPAFR